MKNTAGDQTNATSAYLVGIVGDKNEKIAFTHDVSRYLRQLESRLTKPSEQRVQQTRRRPQIVDGCLNAFRLPEDVQGLHVNLFLDDPQSGVSRATDILLVARGQSSIQPVLELNETSLVRLRASRRLTHQDSTIWLRQVEGNVVEVIWEQFNGSAAGIMSSSYSQNLVYRWEETGFQKVGTLQPNQLAERLRDALALTRCGAIIPLRFKVEEPRPNQPAPDLATPAPSKAEDAKPAKAGWLADPITGCRLWDEAPKAGRAVHWSGECKDGLATENGTADWSLDGEPTEKDVVTYAGGRRTGKGATIYPSGNRYEGEFLNDKRIGHGSFTWSDGTHYEGEFIDGKRTGKGVMTWSNGNRYEGEFLNNMRTGIGVNTLRDGSRYEGEFLKNKWNGKGILIRSDGSREEGNFVNGVRSLDKLPPLPRGAGNNILAAIDATATEFSIKTQSAHEQAAARAYISGFSEKTKTLWHQLIRQSGKDVTHVHGQVVVQFTILREGTVEVAKIIQSAGNDELDHFALKSILLSAPAPPLAKDIPNDRITVRFSFAYIGS